MIRVVYSVRLVLYYALIVYVYCKMKHDHKNQ